MARRYQAYNRTDRRPDKALFSAIRQCFVAYSTRNRAGNQKSSVPLNGAATAFFRAQLFKLIAVHADEGVRWAKAAIQAGPASRW